AHLPVAPPLGVVGVDAPRRARVDAERPHQLGKLRQEKVGDHRHGRSLAETRAQFANGSFRSRSLPAGLVSGLASGFLLASSHGFCVATGSEAGFDACDERDAGADALTSGTTSSRLRSGVTLSAWSL